MTICLCMEYLLSLFRIHIFIIVVFFSISWYCIAVGLWNGRELFLFLTISTRSYLPFSTWLVIKGILCTIKSLYNSNFRLLDFSNEISSHAP